jgi:uncharacterized protein YbaA (DUF1428 family)
MERFPRRLRSLKSPVAQADARRPSPEGRATERNAMSYVQAMVIPVRTDRFDEYRKVAAELAPLWIELGVLGMTEARAHDLADDAQTFLPRALTLEAGEEVVLATMTFRDRAHLDEVIAAGMKHPGIAALVRRAPFDASRLIWGGFVPFVSV